MPARISSRLRVTLTVVLLLSIWGGSPGRALADEEPVDPETEEPSPEEALADSVARFSREFHPELRSSYQVNKTNTTWDQGARLDQWLGPVQLATNWTRSIGANKAQNNREQRSTRGRNRLAYALPDLGSWSFGTNYDLSRSSSSTDFNRQVNDDDALGLFMSTQSFAAPLRRAFGLSEETLTWEVTGTLGVTRAADVNETRNRTTGALTKADSTSSDGVTRDLDAAFRLVPTETLSFDVDASTHRADEDFRTDRPLEPDSSRVLKGKNQDDSDVVTVAALLAPDRKTSFGFNLSRSRTTSQQYSTSQETQDTKDGRDDSFSIDAKAEPFWGLQFDIAASMQDVRTEYAVSDQGAGSDNQKVEGTVRFTMGRGFGFLHTTEFEGSVKIGSNRRVFDNAPAYDEDATALSTLLKRSFGNRLKATLKFEGDLSQTFYDVTGDPAQRSDRDVLRQKLDTSWNYDLRKDLTTQVTVTWSHRETINIAAGKSNTNEEAEEIRVGANYTWSVWPNTTVLQRYSVTANSSTFAFDEGKSNLARQSSLETEIESRIADRARLRFEHEFKFRDSGAFVAPRVGATRRYAKDTDVNQQIVEAEVEYRFAPEFDLYFRQRYDIQETEDVVDEKLTTREILEAFWGANLRHEFDPRFALKVNFERTSSNREPSYWRGRAEVSKSF